MFEESTRTLLCGDLMTQMGNTTPLTNGDLVEAALRAERVFQGTTPGPAARRTLRRLAELSPERLAIMHGASFEGDGRKALLDLAAGLEELELEGNQVAA